MNIDAQEAEKRLKSDPKNTVNKTLEMTTKKIVSNYMDESNIYSNISINTFGTTRRFH
jgi:hypothetical protein